jgi:hypothetical protein
VIHKLKRQLSLLNSDGEDWCVVLVLCLCGCVAGQVRRNLFSFEKWLSFMSL